MSYRRSARARRRPRGAREPRVLRLPHHQSSESSSDAWSVPFFVLFFFVARRGRVLVVGIVLVDESLDVVAVLALARLTHRVPVRGFVLENSLTSMSDPHAKGAGACDATCRSRLTIAAALARRGSSLSAR